MSDSQVLCDEGVLRLDIVIERHSWKRPQFGRIRRTGRLAIAEKRGTDDEVIVRIESLVFTYEPLIVRNCLKLVSDASKIMFSQR